MLPLESTTSMYVILTTNAGLNNAAPWKKALYICNAKNKCWIEYCCQLEEPPACM